MNFESNTSVIIVHDLGHIIENISNEDHSCILCYPPPPLINTPNTFKNFWNWFQQELGARTFSAYTISAFRAFETIFILPESEYRSTRLATFILKTLYSIRFNIRSYSFKVEFYYIQGLASRTNCFKQPISLSTSVEVYNEIIDRQLLDLQQDITALQQLLAFATSPTETPLPITKPEPLFEAIQQVLNTLDPSHIPLPISPPGSPTLVPPVTMSTAAELKTAFEAIFGVNGANLTNALKDRKSVV